MLCSSRILETKYLKQSLSSFIDDFKKSLGVPDHETNIIEACREKILKLYEGSDITDQNNHKHTLITLLDDCSSIITHIDKEIITTTKLNLLSNLYILLSYLKLILTSMLPPIDPLSKITLKKKYYIEEKINFESLNHSYELLNDVYSNSKKTLPNLCVIANEKINLLNVRISELEQYVAVRPQSVNYAKILEV